MNLHLLLFWTFFKISLFSVGGGYNMIPLMQREVDAHDWLTPTEFLEVLALSEATPGPIAVNLATFSGYRTAGVTGAAVATLGVALPGALLLLVLGPLVSRMRQHRIFQAAMRGVMWVLVALLASTAIRLALALPAAAPWPLVLRWSVLVVWTALFLRGLFSPLTGLLAAIPVGFLFAALA